jgi:predicted nucleic acid-binding protein
MVLIDTNVLIDVATKDSVWFDWSGKQLSRLINERKAVINPVIYAELIPLYETTRELDLNLVPSSVIRRIPLPFSAAAPASRAFLAYRKSGGQKTSPLPDFFIGAHAEAEGMVLLTRDASRYRTYFPSVTLISP